MGIVDAVGVSLSAESQLTLPLACLVTEHPHWDRVLNLSHWALTTEPGLPQSSFQINSLFSLTS